jgi:HAD superfamily hydrolase (TIGR01459 family)
MKTNIINSLSQISSQYDVIFCDIWGVIHNGREKFAPALAALKEFRARNKPVILISNSPRPKFQIPAQLQSLDINDEYYDAIVTSGDATIRAGQELGQYAYRLGPPKDDGFFKSLGAQYVPINEAQYIVCTGPRDDLAESAESYRHELAQMLEFGLPFLCANPDKVVQHGNRIIPCGGALADIYQELGGKVIMAGKPFAPIYEMVMDETIKILGKAPDKSRILCIGDGLNTDVLGANNQNYDCLFIADGIHAKELKDENGLNGEMTDAFLKSAKLIAKYAMEFLQ